MTAQWNRSRAGVASNPRRMRSNASSAVGCPHLRSAFSWTSRSSPRGPTAPGAKPPSSDRPLIQEGNTASGKQSSPTGWHREMRSIWCAAGVRYRDKALPADAERRRSEHYWGRTPTPFAFLRLTSPHRNQIAGEPRAGRMAIVASSPRPRREQTTTSSDRRPGGVVGVHTRQRSDYAAGHGRTPMAVSR